MLRALIALGVLLPASLALGAAPELLSGSAGFSAAQAARGQAAYARACVSCHGASLEGGQFGPALKGGAFETRWRGREHAVFLEQVRTTMPPRGQGSVSGAAYGDIVAYIQQTNGVVATLPDDAPAVTSAPLPPLIGSDPGRARGPARRGETGPLYEAALEARTQRLAKLLPVTDAMLRAPNPADWLIWRRSYDGLGYSPLQRIDRTNVHRLRAAWSWSLPESMNEITPLVHNGVMFVHSGPAVQALDAVTGELLWQYLRPLAEEFNNGRDSRVKTLAIYGDKVFAPTTDGHMVALDMRTGRVVWDQEVITDAERTMAGKPEGVALHLNGGPIVAKGRVIVGVSLGLVNSPGGCFIVGLDTETGKEIWRFHTIARPGQPGGDSWNGAPVNERYGGGVWTAGSYDPDLNLVYFGVGNTYNTATLLEPRPGASGVGPNDGLYLNSTLALRPETGELAWHFQHHPREVWDLDWVFEQSVVTLPVNGRPRKLVITGGKTALFDAVDAATGAYVFSHDMGVQNLVTAIDPVSGRKTVNPAVEPEAGKTRVLCPNASGARNWPATALNPVTGILYVPMIESCTEYTYTPRTPAETAAGGSDMRFGPLLPPGTDGRFGRLAAVDLKTRQPVWTNRQRMPIASAALATGGGLLFNGDLDRWFYAYDQADGKVLWRTRLSAAPESFPITYEVDGRQYVAVVAGGGSAFGAGGRGLVPELGAPASGTTLTVFELPPP